MKYFTIFTDKARYSYSSLEYKVTDDDEVYTPNADSWTYSNGIWHKNGTAINSAIRLKVNNLRGLTSARLFIEADNQYHYTEEGHITINSIRFDKPRYYYDAETEDMQYHFSTESVDLPFEQLDDSIGKGVYVDIPLVNISDDYNYYLTISLKHTAGTDSSHTRSD